MQPGKLLFAPYSATLTTGTGSRQLVPGLVSPIGSLQSVTLACPMDLGHNSLNADVIRWKGALSLLWGRP